MTNAELIQRSRDLLVNHGCWLDFRAVSLELCDALEATDKQVKRQWSHGSCCTCQKCGHNYDECRCSLDDVVDELEQVKAKLDKATKSLTDADFHKCRACGDWKEIRQMASPGVCLQCFWKESTS